MRMPARFTLGDRGVAVRRGVFLLALAVLPWLGCHAPERDSEASSAERMSAFASPREAVPRIRQLLRDEDWNALAAYYDLSDSPLHRDDLTSGGFFIAHDTRGLPQPVEVSRYRHPFAPAYRFARVIATADPAIVVVEMTLTIEQGRGMPPQRSLTWFKMKHSSQGWHILPDTAAQEDLP